MSDINLYQPVLEVMEKEKQARETLKEIGFPFSHEVSFPRELVEFFRDEEKVMRAARILKLQSFK